jgi:hypothetical protein
VEKANNNEKGFPAQDQQGNYCFLRERREKEIEREREREREKRVKGGKRESERLEEKELERAQGFRPLR